MINIDRSFKVSFRISHPTLDPDTITAALGLTPTHQHRLGEQKRTPKRPFLNPNYTDNYWGLKPDTSGVPDLIPFLEDLVSRLDVHRDFFGQLSASGGTADLFCGIYLDSNWDESIPHQLSEKLAALKIDLRLDAYPKAYRKPDYPAALVPPRIVAFSSEHGGGLAGNGSVMIHRYLRDIDLLKPDLVPERMLPGDIIGFEYEYGSFGHPEFAWVLFKGKQIVQIIPDGVHSYWFTVYEVRSENKISGAISVVENSAWLRSLNQCHLASCRHFILTTYDVIVEVIARDLVFGLGPFRIEDHSELSHNT